VRLAFPALKAIARDPIQTHSHTGFELTAIYRQTDPVFDVQKDAAFFVAVISGGTNSDEHVFALHARHDHSWSVVVFYRAELLLLGSLIPQPAQAFRNAQFGGVTPFDPLSAIQREMVTRRQQTFRASPLRPAFGVIHR
jgi:hypothetical protein